jgi:hypothetical protein
MDNRDLDIRDQGLLLFAKEQGKRRKLRGAELCWVLLLPWLRNHKESIEIVGILVEGK